MSIQDSANVFNPLVIEFINLDVKSKMLLANMISSEEHNHKPIAQDLPMMLRLDGAKT